MSIARPCKHLGCPKYIVDSRYCDEHVGDEAAADAHRYINDEWAKRYMTGPFVKLSKMVRNKNPLCQRLINGVQCSNPSRICHHRISPRTRKDLFLRVYDENNVSELIALCRDHHPTTDTPDWREGIDFVRTEFQIKIAGG